jgi:hypothetical protein
MKFSQKFFVEPSFAFNALLTLSGLVIRRLLRDRKVAGSILTSGGGILKKNRIRDLS